MGLSKVENYGSLVFSGNFFIVLVSCFYFPFSSLSDMHVDMVKRTETVC